jgi:hypothetical protein
MKQFTSEKITLGDTVMVAGIKYCAVDISVTPVLVETKTDGRQVWSTQESFRFVPAK